MWPLLFINCINDHSKVCKTCDIYLFADDTNVTGLNCPLKNFNQDLCGIEKLLFINKLSLNMDKTVQLNLSNNIASFSGLSMSNESLKYASSCKYLGVYVGSQLFFASY